MLWFQCQFVCRHSCEAKKTWFSKFVTFFLPARVAFGAPYASSRIQQLEEERARAGDEIEATAAAVHELRSREEELRNAQRGVDRERERLTLGAAKAQRMLRRLEDVAAGRTRSSTLSEEELFAEWEKVSHRREKLAAAVDDICDAAPHLESEMDRALTLLSI